MPSPELTDWYDVRDLLGDDERQVQDLVARFVDDRVLPIIAEAFDAHRFPRAGGRFYLRR